MKSFILGNVNKIIPAIRRARIPIIAIMTVSLLSFILQVKNITPTAEMPPTNPAAFQTLSVNLADHSNPYYSYGHGCNCTYYAFQVWKQLGVTLRQKGNAYQWASFTSATLANGQAVSLSKGSTPQVGAIMVFPPEPWNDGYGHVAIVTAIDSNGTVLVNEGNYSFPGKEYPCTDNNTWSGTNLNGVTYLYFPGRVGTSPATGISDGTFIRDSGNGREYIVFRGVKIYISSAALYGSFGITNGNNYINYPDSVVSSLLNIFPNGTLIRDISTSQEFVIYGGVRFEIPNASYYTSYGIANPQNYVNVPPGVVAELPASFGTNSFIRDESNGAEYVIVGLDKIYLNSPSMYPLFGITNGNSYLNLPSGIVALYPAANGNPVPTPTIASPGKPTSQPSNMSASPTQTQQATPSQNQSSPSPNQGVDSSNASIGIPSIINPPSGVSVLGGQGTASSPFVVSAYQGQQFEISIPMTNTGSTNWSGANWGLQLISPGATVSQGQMPGLPSYLGLGGVIRPGQSQNWVLTFQAGVWPDASNLSVWMMRQVSSGTPNPSGNNVGPTFGPEFVLQVDVVLPPPVTSPPVTSPPATSPPTTAAACYSVQGSQAPLQDGNVSSSPFANGSLLQAPDGSEWVLEDLARFHLGSPSLDAAWGVNGNAYQPVSWQTLQNIPTHLPYGAFLQDQATNAEYIVFDNTKFHVPSPSLDGQFGITDGGTGFVPVPDILIQSLSTTLPNDATVVDESTQRLYLFEGGQLHWVPNSSIESQLGISAAAIDYLPSGVIRTMTIGLPTCS